MCIYIYYRERERVLEDAGSSQDLCDFPGPVYIRYISPQCLIRRRKNDIGRIQGVLGLAAVWGFRLRLVLLGSPCSLVPKDPMGVAEVWGFGALGPKPPKPQTLELPETSS